MDLMLRAAEHAFRQVLDEHHDNPPMLRRVESEFDAAHELVTFTAEFSNAFHQRWHLTRNEIREVAHRVTRDYTAEEFCDACLRLYRHLCEQHVEGRIRRAVLETQRRHEREVFYGGTNSNAVEPQAPSTLTVAALNAAYREMSAYFNDRLYGDIAREVEARYRRGIVIRVHNPEADAKAVKLLKEWLSPEQLAEFEAKRQFTVIGQHSKDRYEIQYGTAMNIVRYDKNGEQIEALCFAPEGVAPGDAMLAQKIMLENDEKAALKIANFSPPRPPQLQAV